MKITNNFSVQGMPFALWFNTQVKPFYLQYENFVDATNFANVMANMELLVGKEEMTLPEFCAHFAIIYNETGGTFRPIFEYGGAAYCFNRVMPNGHTKYSYNQAPNRLAGDQLLAWGSITEAERQVWNGQSYPHEASAQVQQAAENCDFYKFRGYGFNQLTWRNAYEAYLAPLLPKPLDSYTTAEFEALLTGNVPLACQAFHNYTYKNPQGAYAMAQVEVGNFVPYGNLVSGGWAWYVQNKYLPRVNTLYQLLLNAGEHHLQNYAEYAIDGYNLTPSQIMKVQNEINALMPHNQVAVDGAWGNQSEAAFKLLEPSGTTIKGLLNT